MLSISRTLSILTLTATSLVGLAVPAGAEPAATSNVTPKACLEAAGMTRPAPGVKLSAAERQAVRATLKSCGIARAQMRRGPVSPQARACLQAAGMTRPAPGVKLSTAERQAVRATLKSCGIARAQMRRGAPSAP